MRLRMIISGAVLCALVGPLSSAGAMSRASAARVKVPNVVGMRMDRATRTLHNVRLRVNEECSGLFGCVVKSRWWICEQDPAPGTRLSSYSVVVIYGERRGGC
jgi:beta-lactam-binding protein with PASTA domain